MKRAHWLDPTPLAWACLPVELQSKRSSARLHHQAHGRAIDPVVFTQIQLDSQLVFNGSDPDLWRRGPVEDATLLMVKTHGSTPPQIRIRAIEKLLHFDRI
ncbi:hypothetical protein FCV25MIE_31909 [Fagus crenata]